MNNYNQQINIITIIIQEYESVIAYKEYMKCLSVCKNIYSHRIYSQLIWSYTVQGSYFLMNGKFKCTIAEMWSCRLYLGFFEDDLEKKIRIDFVLTGTDSWLEQYKWRNTNESHWNWLFSGTMWIEVIVLKWMELDSSLIDSYFVKIFGQWLINRVTYRLVSEIIVLETDFNFINDSVSWHSLPWTLSSILDTDCRDSDVNTRKYNLKIQNYTNWWFYISPLVIFSSN